MLVLYTEPHTYSQKLFVPPKVAKMGMEDAKRNSVGSTACTAYVLCKRKWQIKLWLKQSEQPVV